MERFSSPIVGVTLARGLALFMAVASIAPSAHAQIYVLDGNTNTVKEYSATTGTQITSPFNSISSANPQAIALSGNSLYVADVQTQSVKEYNATTGAQITLTNPISSVDPVALAVSGNSLYVADQGTGTVKEYNATTGALITSGFTTISSREPVALALGPNSLYVGDAQNQTVTEYTTGGTQITNPFTTITGTPTATRWRNSTPPPDCRSAVSRSPRLTVCRSPTSATPSTSETARTTTWRNTTPASKASTPQDRRSPASPSLGSIRKGSRSSSRNLRALCSSSAPWSRFCSCGHGARPSRPGHFS